MFASFCTDDVEKRVEFQLGKYQNVMNMNLQVSAVVKLQSHCLLAMYAMIC